MNTNVKTPAGDLLVLSLLSKEGDGGQLLAREPITHADLSLAREEVWLNGLRAGALGLDLTRLQMQVLPGDNKAAERLAGYIIELRDQDHSFRQHFPIVSLAPAARRAVARLATKGAVDAETEFSFCLATMRPDADLERADAVTDAERTGPSRNGVRVIRRAELPVFEPGRLADYWARSEAITGSTADTADNGDKPMPVFVSDEVWDQGHELARRGGERESAAIWTGRLFRDTQSPEVFVVLDACLEAEHAAEEPLSVTFSGETWTRLREVLMTRRQRLNRPHERLVGSVHGHNFTPSADANGRTMCDSCATARVCGRTTASLSAADVEWHRSVFAGQPWAICLIWGYTARPGEEDWRLYGLANATLTARPIHRLNGKGAS